MVITQPIHLNTRLFSPVFRCLLNTRPFANRTTFDHLNARLVWYSDGYCIWIPTVLIKIWFLTISTNEKAIFIWLIQGQAYIFHVKQKCQTSQPRLHLNNFFYQRVKRPIYFVKIKKLKSEIFYLKCA